MSFLQFSIYWLVDFLGGVVWKANESSLKMSYISDSASLVVEGDLWM